MCMRISSSIHASSHIIHNFYRRAPFCHQIPQPTAFQPYIQKTSSACLCVQQEHTSGLFSYFCSPDGRARHPHTRFHFSSNQNILTIFGIQISGVVLLSVRPQFPLLMLLSLFFHLVLLASFVNGQSPGNFTADLVSTADEFNAVDAVDFAPSAAQPPFYKFYRKHIGSGSLRRCQNKPNPPANGTACGRSAKQTPKVCLWGRQTCPTDSPGGAIHPATRCNCHDNVWTCQDFSCPTTKPGCPVQDPTGLGIAPICSGDMTCGYGELACCDGRKLQKTRYVQRQKL